MNKKFKSIIFIIIIIGVILRFFVSLRGYNYDFLSWVIVGKIVSHGGNVYAQTFRYNYAPLASLVLGVSYWFASFFHNPILIYRFLLISYLTLADLGISYYVAKKSNIFLGLMFFLNPVSIMLTGYHNQFDNVAVLFALIGVEFMTRALKKSSNLCKYDFWAILFLTLSLLSKHLIIIFMLWVLINKTIGYKRKIFYTFVPVALFFISFIPYLPLGLYGIITNVLLYASSNNMPILLGVENLIPNLSKYFIFIFLFLMSACAYIFRKNSIDKALLIYLVCLVCFSSALATQYLAIPLVALFLLGDAQKYVYIINSTIFLLLMPCELHLLIPIILKYPFMISFGYNISTIILFWLLVSITGNDKKIIQAD